MTSNKFSKQYQLRDKISSLATFFLLFDRFCDVRLSSFLSPIFFFSTFQCFDFFYFYFRSPSTSITSSTLSQSSFAQRKILFLSSQSQSGCEGHKNASCISFHRLSSIQFCWIFKRQQRCSKKFFRLRIRKSFFFSSTGIFIYGQNNVRSKKRAGVSNF